MADIFPAVEPTWDLETIFAGGLLSPALGEEIESSSQELERLGAFLDQLPSPSGGLDEEGSARWIGFLLGLFEVRDRVFEVRAFAGAHAAASGVRGGEERRMGEVEELLARLSRLDVQAQGMFRGINEEVMRKLYQIPGAKDLQPWLEGVRAEADAGMEPELEELAVALCRDGLYGWERLYRRVAGELTVRIQVGGEVEELDLGQAAKIWRSPDAAKRKALFEGLQEAWGGVATVCAAALNAKVGVEQTLYKRRGEGCLTRSLRFNRIEEETVETMMEVAGELQPLMNRYLKAKAQGLGEGVLGWWDLHAPLGESQTEEIPYAEAQRFLVDHLERIYPSMGEFVRLAFASRWVEVEERAEKRPGAFCVSFPRSRQVRVFMTYGRDALGDLAHELGHGYHSWKMRDQHSARTVVPITLAETASILAERIVEQAIMEEAKPEEELALLGKRLHQAQGWLVNMRARYELEKAFYRERERGVLDQVRLGELTEEIFGAAYEDAVTPVDSLYWASTTPFYNAGYPFYNYPYTFGYLFSQGLHALARGEPGFTAKIDELLENSGAISCEEAGERYLGVDLRSPEFWRLAGGELEEDVARFEALVREQSSDSGA